MQPPADTLSPATGAPVMLRIDALVFGFGSARLFDGLSAQIGPGVTLVRGGDGRGKTTLLRLLAGVLTPRSGDLVLGPIRASIQPAAWQQRVFWADPHVNDRDQIVVQHWFDSLAGHWPKLDQPLLKDLIDALRLTEHLSKPVYMLSTGSRRKVWLAGAFASGADVTLIDEPFAALDRPAIRLVGELLEDAAAHPRRAWVVADAVAPPDLSLAGLIDLGD